MEVQEDGVRMGRRLSLFVFRLSPSGIYPIYESILNGENLQTKTQLFFFGL
jgi:hypothetical protein